MKSSSLLKQRKIFLFIGDVLLVTLSLVLTLVIRFNSISSELFFQHAAPFSIVFIFLFIVLYIDNLYEANITASPWLLFNHLLRTLLLSAGFAILVFYVGDDRFFNIRPQRILAINWILLGILLYGWRLLFGVISRQSALAEKVLIIGYDQTVPELISTIKQSSAPYKITGIITSQPTKESAVPIVQAEIPDIPAYCVEHDISLIVTVDNPHQNPELSNTLLKCIPLHISVMSGTDFYELIAGKIPVASLTPAWFLDNLNLAQLSMYDTVKRVLDIIIATILLSISLPFWPLIALLIKSTSAGPVFFKQERIGKNSTSFIIVKFRSMRSDAERDGPQWAVQNDSRITSFGSLMRKTRIDELPQLFNIIKGQMSLIGPRPERPEFVKQLKQTIPFYQERLLVKPGLTGWAQVVGPAYGGSVEESLEKLQYDLYYIKNRSLGLDLSIILKTIKTVISSKGH